MESSGYWCDCRGLRLAAAAASLFAGGCATIGMSGEAISAYRSDKEHRPGYYLAGAVDVGGGAIVSSAVYLGKTAREAGEWTRSRFGGEYPAFEAQEFEWYDPETRESVIANDIGDVLCVIGGLYAIDRAFGPDVDIFRNDHPRTGRHRPLQGAAGPGQPPDEWGGAPTSPPDANPPQNSQPPANNPPPSNNGGGGEEGGGPTSP